MLNSEFFRSCVAKRINLQDFLCWFLALIPMAVLAFLVNQYGVDLPTWDHWDYFPRIRVLFEGGSPVLAAWGQSNEHRCFFANLLQMDLAWLTGWNVRAELALDLFLALVVFAIIVRQIRLTEEFPGGRKMRWLIPVSALVIFSLNQWENWVWGAQVVVFFQVMATALCFFHLTNFPSRWSDYFRALAMGVIASFSFGSGLLVWPVGTLILALFPPKAAKKRKMLLWGLAGMAVLSLYLRDYLLPYHNPQAGFAFYHPLNSFYYFFVFLGTAVINFNLQWAFWAGWAGAAGFCLALLYLTGIRRIPVQVLMPYLAWALYSAGSGLMLVVTRSCYGEMQAASPRYIIHANFLWIALCVLLSMAFFGKRTLSPVRKWGAGIAGICFFCFFVFLSAKSSAFSVPEFRSRYAFLTAARLELRHFRNEKLLLRLYPDIGFLKQGVEFLKKYRLSAFRNG